jgi:exonuclease SbcD
MVMLGSDLVLPTSLVRDPRLDYVALGHIHKPQNLNEGAHPPVIYPGSIERVDFGEAADDRFFVIADVQKHSTRVEWRKLEGARPFIDRRAVIQSGADAMETLKAALPGPAEMEGAIVRLIIEYPREYDSSIDESELRRLARSAFEFHLVRRPQTEARIRLPADQTASSLSPLDLLDQYWRAAHTDPAEMAALQKLAREIVSDEDNESGNKSL